ncbi:MAG: NUDIX hydrolase [Alphaproteobacteria bacterium]
MVSVSVKGVVFVDGRVLLLKNEREEWELPGGKLEPDEEPDACCRREILEETALRVRTTRLLDAWLYRVAPEGQVLILTYGCAPLGEGKIAISHEHRAGALFPLDEIAHLPMPDGYRRSIDRWRRELGRDG